MATPSKRSASLSVDAQVTGQDDLRKLGESVKAVGDAAKASTPDLDRMAQELDALAAATKAQREAEKSARADAAAAKRDLDGRRTALELLRAETDKTTRATAEHEAKEKALRVAVVEARAALRDKQAASAAAADAARNAAAAEATLAAQIKQAGAAAITSASQQAVANREVSSTLQVLQGQLATLRNIAGVALGGSLVGSLARDLGQTADAYSNLAARIKIATAESGTFEATFSDVFKVAQRTGVAVEDVGALVVKLAQAGRELNLSGSDALRLAESVAQATQLSGASAQEAAAAVTQFSQAIASGRLQGDELRSLLENSPRLAQALADGLGVAVGQLKELGSTGALTSAQVVQALQGQSAALQREFDQLPLTVGRAITNLGTAWTQYIGQTDQATGASRAAAEAIGALARNLDLVAGVLFGVGKAAAAYAALRLAETFLANAAAATALATATTAATAATVANTAAQAGNAAATAASTASAGRLAGVLGTLKTLTFLGVVTNLRSIGETIGETVAKWAGYGAAIERAEAATKADEAAARANAAAKAELAQRLQQAADKALGLDKQSQALVATFDGLKLKGESTADALGKIGKQLDLSDVRGITTASAALDALAQRGKITADQLRDTLGAALKGEDLARFETQARAAFDGTAQGVRRLQAALDALADESLRRVGTSARELATGFSAASTSAINDLDALTATLDKLGTKGDDAGRLLAKGIDQALAAASTERAVRAVIERLTDLGSSGLLAGERVAQGLQAAQRKLDDMRSGVNSLDEAMRSFGLKTRAELQATADKLGESYRVISASAGVSLQDQAKAFTTWRDAAVAATGGVESEQVKLQRVILENRLAAAGLGDSIESAMNRAGKATERAAATLARYTSSLAAGINGNAIGAGGSAGTVGSVLDPVNKSSRPDAPAVQVGGAQVRPPDDSGNWEFVQDARYSGGPNTQADVYSAGVNGRPVPRGSVSGVGYWKPKAGGPQSIGGSTGFGGLPQFNSGGESGGSSGLSGAPFGRTATAPAPAPTSAPAPGAAPSTVVNVTIGQRTYSVDAANRAAADVLVAALEEAHRAGGGT